ncbi:hypothetical protein OIU74_027361 [Salix koriyanagi]|uniref:Uncharacterized protein n=1 Tax=Salix koriyanagi TaxID=2511006 RepID=A0A9Q0W0R2_9ROSI|nr:hypothetical protein OIU74_027361 [Salix koriyanagi]
MLPTKLFYSQELDELEDDFVYTNQGKGSEWAEKGSPVESSLSNTAAEQTNDIAAVACGKWTWSISLFVPLMVAWRSLSLLNLWHHCLILFISTGGPTKTTYQVELYFIGQSCWQKHMKCCKIVSGSKVARGWFSFFYV